MRRRLKPKCKHHVCPCIVAELSKLRQDNDMMERVMKLLAEAQE